MVLGKMRDIAETYLGEKVTHAVVTVPACESSIDALLLELAPTRPPGQTSMTLSVKLPRMPAP